MQKSSAPPNTAYRRQPTRLAVTLEKTDADH